MVAFDGSERCGEAEAYYQEFLDDEARPCVPAAVIDHIQNCGRCRDRLARLRELLSEVGEADEARPSWRDGRLVAELQSHFECLDEPVTCARAKPFLPSLLDPSVKIRIPTPITVHVDHCPACGLDLESLQELELDSEQLARLSGLYAQGSADGVWDGFGVRAGVHVARPGLPEDSGAEVPDRLSVLSRQERFGSSGPEAVSCEDISWADIFDCVVSCGLGADESGRTQMRQTCRAHVALCSACLERTEALYETLRTIAQRSDSEIVTVCSTTQDASPGPMRAGMPYGGYPLDVKVLGRPAVSRPGDSGAVPQRRTWRTRFRPLFKTAALAAAMIPLAILFFFNSPTTATGITMAQINQVLAQAKNVYVAQSGKDASKLVQESWASGPQGILISKTADVSVIFDLKNRFRSTNDGGRVIEKNTPLTDNEYEAVDGRVQNLLGMNLARHAWDSELSEIEDPVQAALGIAVYELAWESSRFGGPVEPRKWRIYVDATRNLPQKAEFSQWDRAEQKLVVTTTRCFEYSPAGDIQQRVEELLSSK